MTGRPPTSSVILGLGGAPGPDSLILLVSGATLGVWVNEAPLAVWGNFLFSDLSLCSRHIGLVLFLIPFDLPPVSLTAALTLRWLAVY